MSAKTPFYITTAISYVNGVPHLGHAYEVILTDVMARFKRLDGYDVWFLTGTDEHGEKVAQTAEKNGMEPKAFADQNAEIFRELTGKLSISNDDFIRTTEERHYVAAQAMWQKLQDNGDIYLGQYEGWYSIREEAYFTEDELNTGEDGKKYTPLGTEAEWVEEPSYFFKLSAYTDRLIEYYAANMEAVQPSTRLNEIVSFLKQEGGLKDLSVSRHKSRLKWGIPVPGDDDHVMYVWLDALTNYITALGYPDEQAELYKKFWPADFHVIGKDITRFHAIYWPAFLMAANIPLPKAIFAHGFINVEGQKMSKSIGNVLSPDDLIKAYGLDQLRYFLMREIPHGNDGNFSHEQAVQRMNADLANGLGNLSQRTLSMIYKNCDEKIPQPQDFTEEDQELLNSAYTVIDQVRGDFDSMKINSALEKIWTVVAACDAYVDAQAPWALKKTDVERMNTVLYVLADAIRCLAIAVQPVTPDSSSKILDQLKIPQDERFFIDMVGGFLKLGEKIENPELSLKPGTSIDKPEGVFPRIVEEEAA
ncbi:MAG: methionine--tRNA ligase [Alphaproteobacteria bacterium]|nr:methionine--tRNA ligase [Alphaproteobacteria bacterium]